MQSGHANLVAGDRLEVAHHVADARVAGHVDALALRVGQLRAQGRQAEAEEGLATLAERDRERAISYDVFLVQLSADRCPPASCQASAEAIRGLVHEARVH